MPSTSRAQHNFFEMIAHDPAKAEEKGVSQSIGKEFVEADKGKPLGRLPIKKGMVKGRVK